MNIMITNNQLAERFEIAHDGSMAILEYIIKSGQMTLVHTEVPEELGGKGFGGFYVRPIVLPLVFLKIKNCEIMRPQY